MTCTRYGKKGHPSDRYLFVWRGCEKTHVVEKCQTEYFYNLLRQPDQARWNYAGEGHDDNKLERFPCLNLIQAKRLNFCIFAHVEKQPKEDMGIPAKTIEIHRRLVDTLWSTLLRYISLTTLLEKT